MEKERTEREEDLHRIHIYDAILRIEQLLSELQLTEDEIKYILYSVDKDLLKTGKGLDPITKTMEGDSCTIVGSVISTSIVPW